MRLQLVTTPEPQPDFLELPWSQPVEQWGDLLLDVPAGLHRHVVGFVRLDGRVYVVKELPADLAAREFRLLRHLEEEGLPVVDVVGVAADRSGDLEDVLITRHLEYSLPYRFVIGGNVVPQIQDAMLDAAAALLVRIHLAGFFWGDCSLSNVLFRRDAGALSAYLVDTETGELHETLTDRQRDWDLEIARMNILGGLEDLAAMGRLPEDLDSVDIVDDLVARYNGLWEEITKEERFGHDERYRIAARLHRINDLGFDTEEIELKSTDDGRLLAFKPRVVEEGHHRRLLTRLTGLEAQENQARRMLNDIWSYRAHLEAAEERQMPEAVAAYRWIVEVYEPTLAEIPDELKDRREAAELLHEIMEHRWYLAEQKGADIKLADAATDFVQTILPYESSEQSLIDT